MKRWPTHEAYFWERAPFFRLLFPLIVGIILYKYTWLQDYVLWATILFIISAISYTLVFKRSKVFSFVLTQLSLLVTGWLCCYQTDIKNNKNWLGHHLKDDHQYLARITHDAEEKNRTWKYDAAVTHVINGTDTIPAVGKASLYIYKYSGGNFKEGDIVYLPNKWQGITNAGNPHEFDYAGFCANKNIYHQQFLSGRDVVIYKYADQYNLSWVRRVHHWCIDQLEYYIHDHATLGLLEAILVGERSTLDTSTKQSFANTGIIHVIAISGAHISIFFVLVVFLLGFIKHRKYRWVKYLSAVPLIWLYVLVAGAPPSAVRAALMFSLLAIGFAFQKQQNGINQLLATAFFLLLIEPNWLFTVGFQLSFLAVLSLLLFYKRIYRLLKPTNKIIKLLWGTIAASIAAEILIAPLVIYYFHLFPAQFIVANILAYVFMSSVLVLGMGIVILSPIQPLAAMLGKLTIYLVTQFNILIQLLEPFNPTSFQHLQIGVTELTLTYMVITGITLFITKKKKAALLTGVISFALLLTMLAVNDMKARKAERLVIYNINRTGYIEYITNKKYQVVASTKELDEATPFYTLRPAHIQWYSWRQDSTANTKRLFTIDNNNILIINSKKDNLPNTLIHTLVVNYNIKEADFLLLIERYSPQQLVFTSRFSRKKTKYWDDKRASFDVPIHITGIDGAYIIAKK